MKKTAKLLALALTVAFAFAQSDRGTITGTVADASGSLIPDAKVTIVNTETGTHSDTATTATGNYTVPSLPVGAYSLTVEHPGFSKYQQTNLKVQVAVTTRVDVVLQVGQATQSVEVSAESTLLKTESAEQSTTVSGDLINNLPINFAIGAGAVRNPLSFVQLSPGASISGWNTIKVNGNPTGTFKIMFEGQESSSTLDARVSDESQPSVEAIQEFTLQTSNFSAEFGQVAGGLFNFTSKSGTNQFHGSAYDYVTNEAFGAGVPFTDNGNGGHIRAPERRQDLGGSVGGPVWIPKVYKGRNRTFFFFNYEMYRDKANNFLGLGSMPTDAMRNGDFSGILTNRNLGTDPYGRAILENTIYDPGTSQIDSNGKIRRDPFPGNIIPKNRFDPTAVKILSYIPPAQNQALINNYTLSAKFSKVQAIPSIKIDHNFSDRSKISGYYAQQRTDKDVGQDGIPDPISSRRSLFIMSRNVRINYNYSITPTLLFHIGAGIIRYRNPDTSPPGITGFDEKGLLGILGTEGPGFPRITGIGSGNFGGINSALGSGGIGPVNRGLYLTTKPTGVADLSWVHGNHTYKAGADWKLDEFTNFSYIGLGGSFAFSSAETGLPSLAGVNLNGGGVGFGLASFLLGQYDSASISNTSAPQYRRTAMAMYVQDTWKINRKMTLDYGVRYDYQHPMHELWRRTSTFRADIPNPNANNIPGAVQYEGSGPGRCNCTLVKTYPWAFAPRFGMAYQLDKKMVVRAGWGLSYSTVNNFAYIGGGNSAGMGFNNVPFSSPQSGVAAGTLSQPLVYDPNLLYGASYNPGLNVKAGGPLSGSPSNIDPNGGRPPRVNQWNISIQREIAPDLVVEGAFVGNHGVWFNATGLLSYDATNPTTLVARGLDITNATDRGLLTSSITSPQVVARGFTKPYPGFPDTGTLAQALRPFPQFNGVGATWAPLGSSWYDALQVKATKRFSHGLDFIASYAWSKNESTVESTSNNVFNRQNVKSISSLDQPQLLTISFNYLIPAFGAMNRNHIARTLLSGWTLGGILSYSSGLPIQSPGSNNSLSSLLFQNTFQNRVPGVPLYLKDLNCHCFDPNKDFVLNPAAWTDPAPGTWGTAAAYYSDYRFERRPQESLSLGKRFAIRERMAFSVRAEFFNVFNRMNVLPNPTTSNPQATQSRNAAGVPTGGFGYINVGQITTNNQNNTNPAPRTGQIVARFEF
jgi:hypothetical protein